VDPAVGLDGPRDLLTARGTVQLVAEEISPGEARRQASRGRLTVVQAEGLWLWPGLVDMHVHLRDPGFTHKETLASGGAAAASGGFTSIVCEPNTDPPIDCLEMAREVARRADAEAPVNVYLKAAMTVGRRGREPTDVAALAAEPSVVALSDDGDPIVDPAVMAQVCRLAAGEDILMCPHCEDSPHALEQLRAGADPGFKPGRPFTNEAHWVERDIGLAARAGCRIHLSHVSLAESVAVIAAARSEQRVTWEVTPHHLLLTSEEFPDGPVPAVNPPLRTTADRDCLRGALAAGRVDAIADDHAPHTAQDKEAGACGLIGMETTLGLVLTHFVASGVLSASDAVRLMSWSPACIMGLPGGTLVPGSPADLVVIDPDLAWTVEPGEFCSKSRNTPFAGWPLRGRAVATYVAGREVHALPDYASRRGG
jgi:dihydroorotase